MTLEFGQHQTINDQVGLIGLMSNYSDYSSTHVISYAKVLYTLKLSITTYEQVCPKYDQLMLIVVRV